jgi:uncharacterized protein (TIRG00374 family)
VAKSSSHLRAVAATAAKALVSIGLIALALRGVDSAAVFARLGTVQAHSVVLAALATTGICLLHARRWEVVLARMEHELPFAEALRLVLIGYFFNQTLPSTIGGDAYRAWGAYKRGIHAGNAVASVLVDRLFALLALVVMIGAGSWWLFALVKQPLAQWTILGVCAAGVLGFALLLALPRFADWLRPWRVTRLLLHVAHGARAVMGRATAVLQVIVLTIAGYAVLSFAVYLLAQGLGVALELGHALLFVPLVTLVTVLPVSIAGWGLRENAMVVSLGLIGVPSADAFSVSVLFGLVVMVSGVPGGVLWLLGRRGRIARASTHEQPQGTP